MKPLNLSILMFHLLFYCISFFYDYFNYFAQFYFICTYIQLLSLFNLDEISYQPSLIDKRNSLMCELYHKQRISLINHSRETTSELSCYSQYNINSTVRVQKSMVIYYSFNIVILWILFLFLLLWHNTGYTIHIYMYCSLPIALVSRLFSMC